MHPVPVMRHVLLSLMVNGNGYVGLNGGYD